MVKVLIADSNKQAATDTGGHLRHMGYEVDYALDGKECLKKVNKGKPNIIISEIDLPNLDGISLLKKLKKNKKTKNIPIFILTNVEDIEKRTEATSLGVSVYFLKSKTSKEVLDNWIKELAI